MARHRGSVRMDGRVRGLPVARNRGSIRPVAAPVSVGGIPPQEYDPIHTDYQFPDPTYEAVPDWFDGFSAPPTPAIRIDPPDTSHQEQINYDSCLMTPDTMERMMEELQLSHEEPVSLEHAVGTPIDDAPEIAPVEEGMIGDVESLDVPESHAELFNPYDLVPPMELEALESIPNGTPFDEMGGLEQIVDETVPDTGPMDYGITEMTNDMFETAMRQEMDELQPSPYAQIQEMYEDQLQMMDPYMVPNPPMPGPFGPMPGP